jgi:hypothetical protein|tara:strand:- start:131 stop:349 length:219 start_codon:yes stop_codon:yes gene_type:complete
LISDESQIVEYFQELESESRAIEKQIFEICWYMRGGVTLEEAWTLSFDQRSTIMDIINDNIERTKNSGIALM